MAGALPEWDWKVREAQGSRNSVTRIQAVWTGISSAFPDPAVQRQWTLNLKDKVHIPLPLWEMPSFEGPRGKGGPALRVDAPQGTLGQ